MKILVLIDPIGPDRYRACAGSPFPFTTEGATPHDAVEGLKRFIKERLDAGAHITSIDVPAHESPIAAFAGMLDPADPVVQDWLKIMEENRRKADEEPNPL